MKFVLLLAMGVLVSPAAPPDPNAAAKERYLAFGKCRKEIAATFHSRTIERRLLFSIDVKPEVFQALFGDLGFAVKMARLHAKKLYEISNAGPYYKAWDGERTWATIWPIHADAESGTYVYFIQGVYKGGITVSGSMVMEVSFQNRLGNTFFRIATYISIDDPFMRELTQFLRNFKSFKDYLDRLIDGTVGEIRRVGFITARGLVREGAPFPPRVSAP
ncbi:MAG: hypothetical protein J0L75_15660 [Spirochaetes bacterium]|nr:hypothetical protein [Spirochaetota bacterium]